MPDVIDFCGEYADVRSGDYDTQQSRAVLRRGWRVIVNNKLADAHTILGEAIERELVPQFNSEHPSYSFATLRNYRVTCTHPWKGWTIEAQYSSEPLQKTEEERQSEPDPLLRAAKISWETHEYTEPVFRDVDGQAILNSAGEYYDPPPERVASYWVVNVEKNMPGVPVWLLDYANAVNDDEFAIDGIVVQKGCAKLSAIGIGEPTRENGVWFRKVTMRFEIRKPPHGFRVFLPNHDPNTDPTPAVPYGWHMLILDQGLRQRVATGELFNIVDNKKREITSPWPLDGKGKAIVNPTPANGVFFRYKIYPERDFSILPLT